MFPQRGKINFDDRCSDSDGSAGLQIGLAVKPPILRRLTVVLIALGGIFAIVYGTLVPFNFHLDQPVAWQLTLHTPQSGDFISNVIVYVPIGIFLRLLFRRRGSWWLTESVAALIVAGGISYSAEVLQSMLPARVPSLTDSLANVGGAFIGLLLAPAFQRRLRLFHAWLYSSLRIKPFSVAAGLTTVFLSLYAVVPFDVHPTPGHVTAQLNSLRASWVAGLSGGYGLGTADLAAKTLAAASYGFLAFLLVVAKREDGRSLLGSCGYGLSRAVALSASIEAMQLFMVSHCADWRDLELGIIASVTGVSMALIILWFRPLIYRDPIAMVGPAMPLIGMVCVAWAFADTVQTVSGGRGGAMRWLPVMGSFNRSWDSLVTCYSAAFMNYTLIASLIALWWRGRRSEPAISVCVIGAILVAALLQISAVLAKGAEADTGHLVVAFVAGITAYRIDRAICGRRFRVGRERRAANSDAPLDGPECGHAAGAVPVRSASPLRQELLRR